MFTTALDKTIWLLENNVSFTFFTKHYAIIYITRTNKIDSFHTFISFFSILFYIVSLFWMKTTSRNALIFRDFIISILIILLGIRLHGNPPVVQGLIVANHRSYFDPIMLNHRQTFPVGKRNGIMATYGYIYIRSDFLLTEKILKVDRTLAKALKKH
jgi:1-acyl-sn-glycerol-3-phosphate acyltransferase